MRQSPSADFTPQLLFSYTGADLTLDAVDPDAHMNWWDFDLTGIPAPPNGYRLVGSYAHSGGFHHGDKGMYIPINFTEVDQWNYGGTWYDEGNSLVNPQSTNPIIKDGSRCTLISLPSTMNFYEFTQDLIVAETGGFDFVYGEGTWTLGEDDNALRRQTAYVTKAQKLPTSHLDGSFKHIRYINGVTNNDSAGTGCNLLAEPLDKLELKLYAI